MPNFLLSSSAITRNVLAFGLFCLAYSASGGSSLYAQNIVIVAANPVAASSGSAVSVTAAGFTQNVAVGPVTMTLTPQFAGAVLTATGTVQGLGTGRSINYIQPIGAAGDYTLSVFGSGVTSSNTLTVTLLPPPSFTLNPVSGVQGATIQVTLTPAQTSFPLGTTANFGPGISVGGAPAGTAGPVAIQGNGAAIATLVISPAAAVGGRTVQIAGTDTITQANAFTVTPNTPLTLISVNPAFGPPGVAVSVLASGFILNDTPTLTVTLTPNGGGTPITAAATIQGLGVSRSVNFILPPATPAGLYAVTLGGSNYSSANSLPFTVTPPPAFTLIPSSGFQGNTLQVTIAGSNTTFPLGATTANFGPGISVGGAAENSFGPVAVQPNGTAIASLVINLGAAVGARTVQVNGLDAITQPNAFTVLQHTFITLITINPASGPPTSAVSITATGFVGTDFAAPLVILTPNAGGSPLTASGSLQGTGVNRSINFVVPPGAPLGLYTVTISGGDYSSSNSLPFTVTPAPSFTLNPSAGNAGATLQVVITGANTTFPPGATTVNFGPGISVGGSAPNTFGPVVVQPNGTAIASLTIDPGATLGPRTVQVIGLDQITQVNAFTVAERTLTLLTIAPSPASPNSSVAITGSGFDPSGAVTGLSVTLTPLSGPPIVVAATTGPSGSTREVVFTVPTGTALGNYSVTVSGNGYVSGNSLPFVISGPATFSLSPTSGQRGEILNIVLTGQNTSFNAGSTVSFGPNITVNGVIFGSASSLTANITIDSSASLGPRSATVTTGGVPLTSANTFTVTPAPVEQITSVNPPAGEQGQTLALTVIGLNTHFTALSTVSLGAGITVNSVTRNSDTSLTVGITIAPSATVGTRDVMVTTGATTVTGSGLFSVTAAPARQILSVVPGTATQGDALNVIITGLNTNFSPASVVSIGLGVTVNSVTFLSATSLSASLTVDVNAEVGPRNVSVITGSENVFGGGLFTVRAQAPQVLSVAPSSGLQGQTLNVTINGANFRNDATVSFGPGITVNQVTFGSSTTLTASITIAAGATPGSRDVTVTSNGLQAALANAFTVHTGPVILSVVLSTGVRNQTLNVAITGSSTSFAQGVSQVTFGQDITVNSVTVGSATTLTANITIAPQGALGSRTVTVTTGSQVVSLQNGFSVLSVPQSAALTCATNAGVPPTLRGEGFTELTGDLILICTGGTAGETSSINIQLFLNVPITSRLTGSQSEALLIVDELAGPIYRAVAGQNETSVVWAGVSFVAPGPGAQRTFRITNVRANVTSLAGSASIVPSQVFAFLSVSPSQSLPLTQAQFSVGFVLPGLIFDVTNCNGSGSGAAAFAQCVNENSSGNRDLIGGTTGNMQFAVRFREGFHSSFKRQLAPGQATSVPGFVYNSESGFLRTPELPYSVGGADTGTRLVARFNNIPDGVRLFVATRPSAGSTSGLDAVLVQTGPNAAGGTFAPNSPAGVASTATLFCPLANTEGVGATEIPVINNSAMAVWEVTAANFDALETAVFGVAVAYTPNTPNQRPSLGQASVAGSFGPFYAATSNAGKMSSSLPIPRFLDAPTVVNAFRIDPCVTNLLFPFVTNREGFDTGIAIANTSTDPFASGSQRQQSGACTLNYYGTTSAGPAPSAQRSSPVLSGASMTFVLSSGGSHGVAATPAFQGYIIAQCEFRYGHGFAFVTDGPIGMARVAEGYLALVMDNALPSRGATSESLNH